MAEKNNPLVSIIVITYNSEKYVLETLESVRQQTYKNIELIISDDFSTDNTISLCKDWLNIHKSAFVSTCLITVTENTGIPANCNRGLSEAKGAWIKIIAGDDTLLSNCIEDNVNFVGTSDEIKFCHSLTKIHKEEFLDANYIKSVPVKTKLTKEYNSQKQFNILKISFPTNASTFFFHTDIIRQIGGFNTSFPIEDWPFLLMVTLNGYKIHFLNKETTAYRWRINSITRDGKKVKMINDFYKKKEKVVYELLWPYLTFDEKFYYRYEFWRLGFLKKHCLDTNSFSSILVRKITALPSWLFVKKVLIY